MRPSPEELQMRSDRGLLSDIPEWSTYAPALVQEIGALRDAPPDRRDAAIRFRLEDEPDLVPFFHQISMRIAAAAAIHHPAEPYSAILDLASHVERFYRSGAVEGLPVQAELVAAYNRCAATINVLICATRERVRKAEADAKPAEAKGPTTAAPEVPLILGDDHLATAQVWTGKVWITARLTRERHLVLERLLEAYTSREGAITLETLSEICGGARAVLRGMRLDPTLGRIIRPRGKRGTGYSLKMPDE